MAVVYFVVVEKLPPQKLAGAISDMWEEPSSTPRPVTEEGTIDRAYTSNELYWAIVDAATLDNCRDAIRVRFSASSRFAPIGMLQ